MSTEHRNDISTEPSPGADEHDNLGAEDGKSEQPTEPPTNRDDEPSSDVTAEDPSSSD